MAMFARFKRSLTMAGVDKKTRPIEVTRDERIWSCYQEGDFDPSIKHTESAEDVCVVRVLCSSCSAVLLHSAAFLVFSSYWRRLVMEMYA
jgi:hypothetical protein